MRCRKIVWPDILQAVNCCGHHPSFSCQNYSLNLLLSWADFNLPSDGAVARLLPVSLQSGHNDACAPMRRPFLDALCAAFPYLDLALRLQCYATGSSVMEMSATCLACLMSHR